MSVRGVERNPKADRGRGIGAVAFEDMDVSDGVLRGQREGSGVSLLLEEDQGAGSPLDQLSSLSIVSKPYNVASVLKFAYAFVRSSRGAACRKSSVITLTSHSAQFSSNGCASNQSDAFES